MKEGQKYSSEQVIAGSVEPMCCELGTCRRMFGGYEPQNYIR